LLSGSAHIAPQGDRPATFSWRFTLLKLALTALAVGVVLRSVDLSSAWQRLADQRFGLVLLAVAVAAVQIVVAGLRWHVIVKELAPRADVSESLRLYYIGNFFNAFLLGTVGGDVMRAWLSYRIHASMSAAALSVLLDRVAALAGLAILLIATMPLALSRIGNEPALVALAVLAALGFVGIGGVAQLDRLPSRWLRWRPLRLLHMLGGATRTVFLRPAVAVPALVLAVISQFLVAYSVYFVAVSLDAGVSLLDCVLLMQVVTFVTSLPISLGGWGVREAAMIALFGLVGVPASTTLVLSVECGLLGMAITLPAGVSWLMLNGTMGRGAPR
jgi:uncharacterized protein (TIRG00374 family)